MVLNLEADEYEYLRLTVQKLWRNRKAKGMPRESALRPLKDQFETNFSERPIPINRVGTRILSNIVKVALKEINATIIPGYEARIKEQPDNKEKYETYIKRSQDALGVLGRLDEKLEDLL